MLATAAPVAILMLPTPADLPIAGHRMLAILGFAVIVWITETLDYAISAVVVAAPMAFMLGTSKRIRDRVVQGQYRRTARASDRDERSCTARCCQRAGARQWHRDRRHRRRPNA